jgi:hypothetical protein
MCAITAGPSTVAISADLIVQSVLEKHGVVGKDDIILRFPVHSPDLSEWLVMRCMA